MMCGSSGGRIGGRGAGGDDSYNYNRKVCTSIDHGGRHHHMAAIGPHSQFLRIQQSTNILCNRTRYVVQMRKTYHYYDVCQS
jgi:hypothetical protein